MNKKNLLLITVSAIALFFSCSKEKRYHTTVNGVDIETYQSQAIAGATVSLLEKEDDGGIGSIGSGYSYGSSIQTTTSASDGSYSFEFTARKKYIYFVTAEKTECEKNDDASYVKVTAKEDNENKNIPLIAYGYVKLHIKNITNPLTTDEFLIDNFIHSSSAYANHDHLILLNGNSADYYTKKDGALTISFLKANIPCIAFDTTHFDFNY